MTTQHLQVYISCRAFTQEVLLFILQPNCTFELESVYSSSDKSGKLSQTYLATTFFFFLLLGTRCELAQFSSPMTNLQEKYVSYSLLRCEVSEIHFFWSLLTCRFHTSTEKTSINRQEAVKSNIWLQKEIQHHVIIWPA